jgi:hypothetical protein
VVSPESMTDSPSSEAEGIERWIQSQGYPLEMRTARKLRRCHFTNVMESVEYGDPIEGTLRQCDVLVTEEVLSPLGENRNRVSLVFECKYARGSPWLVLRRPSSDHETQTSLLPRLTGGVGYYLPEAISQLVFGSVPESSWYRDTFGQSKVVGFRAIEVPLRKGGLVSPRDGKKAQRDPAFDAIRQVLAAGEAKARASSGVGPPELVLPVVVIDGQLYASRLRGEAVKALPTDGVAAVVHRLPSSPAGPGIPAMIVTYRALSRFALRFHQGLAELQSEIDTLVRGTKELGNRTVIQALK